MLGSARYAIGLSHQLNPPDDNALRPPPPPVTIHTPHTGSRFHLALSTGKTYTGSPILILAAPSQLHGKDTWPATAFAPLGFVPALGPEPADVANLYAAKYGPVPAGMDIGLHLNRHCAHRPAPPACPCHNPVRRHL